MKSILENEFTQEKYDKKKFYGSYELNNATYVVGPFNTTHDTREWLDRKYQNNSANMTEEYFLLNEMDIHAILERNKPANKKPKM